MPHTHYRGFWICNTRQNRRKVDKFLDGETYTIRPGAVSIAPKPLFTGLDYDLLPQIIEEEGVPLILEEEVLKHIRDVVVHDIRCILDKFSPQASVQAKADVCREFLRQLVKCHPLITSAVDQWNWRNFLVELRHKLLEYCRSGVSEAFLVFGLYFPKMCTREIQPFFNFKGSCYTDAHWLSLELDPQFNKLGYKMFYMSGFNRNWRKYPFNAF